MKKFYIYLLCFCFFPLISGCEKNKRFTPEYTLDLVLEKDILQGESIVEFVLESNGYVDFNLFGSAYRENAKYFALDTESLPVDKKYGDMKILSVNSQKFISYETLNDNALLRVYLNASKGERVKIYIKFCVILSNFSHRLSISNQVVNLGNFYPILCVYDKEYVFCPYYNIGDPFYSKVANYNVSLKCDGDYVVASSGFCDKVEVAYGMAKYYYSIKNSRDFALCLSKDFKVAKDNFNGTEIYYYYLNGESVQELQIIKDSLKYFSNFYTYPYKTYSVCQTDFCYGGMEYSGLVYINKNLKNEDKYITIVHETAHQWWYGVVGNNQIKDACLDEGLTEFSTIIFFENFTQYNISSQNLINQKITSYTNFVSAYKVKYGLDYNFKPTRSLTEYQNWIDYTLTAYYYMPYCFYQIYNYNKTDFIKILKCFAKDYAYKEATLLTLNNYLKGTSKTYYQSVLNAKCVCG